MATRSRRRESFTPDPTPDDIRRATAVIREAWSPREHQRRSHYQPTPWMPPMMPARDVPEVLFESDNRG